MRVVISDLKLDDGSGSFLPDEKSYTNFYPYGMPHPNRSWTAADGDYRYGFNGVEKEQDVYGKGNLSAMDFRMYDSRVGRWWGVDKIVKVDESPYAAMAGNPINFADPSGLEVEGKKKVGPGPTDEDAESKKVEPEKVEPEKVKPEKVKPNNGGKNKKPLNKRRGDGRTDNTRKEEKGKAKTPDPRASNPSAWMPPVNISPSTDKEIVSPGALHPAANPVLTESEVGNSGTVEYQVRLANNVVLNEHGNLGVAGVKLPDVGVKFDWDITQSISKKEVVTPIGKLSQEVTVSLKNGKLKNKDKFTSADIPGMGGANVVVEMSESLKGSDFVSDVNVGIATSNLSPFKVTGMAGVETTVGMTSGSITIIPYVAAKAQADIGVYSINGTLKWTANELWRLLPDVPIVPYTATMRAPMTGFNYTHPYLPGRQVRVEFLNR